MSAQKTYDYYNKNTFWNDHYVVREYINELITGDKNTNWMRFVYEKYFKTKRKVRILSVGCGNGWQDRDLSTIFPIEHLDGFDVSESLLKEAREKAPSPKRFAYKHLDLNRDPLPKRNCYDLAINVAALHHIANMRHLVKQVYLAIKKGGLFVNYDYIGPKRNQYSDQDLYYMNWIQQLLPGDLVGREPIKRPDVKVMLREDPSEAVGSELIIKTLNKYFDIDFIRYYNGGLLYQTLYNKIKNFDPSNDYHTYLLKLALELERAMTASGEVKPLFAFIICKKKDKLLSLRQKVKNNLEKLLNKISLT